MAGLWHEWPGKLYFKNGVAEVRKPSGRGRARHPEGLAPCRYGNLKNAPASNI